MIFRGDKYSMIVGQPIEKKKHLVRIENGEGGDLSPPPK